MITSVFRKDDAVVRWTVIQTEVTESGGRDLTEAPEGPQTTDNVALVRAVGEGVRETLRRKKGWGLRWTGSG